MLHDLPPSIDSDGVELARLVERPIIPDDLYFESTPTPGPGRCDSAPHHGHDRVRAARQAEERHAIESVAEAECHFGRLARARLALSVVDHVDDRHHFPALGELHRSQRTREYP